MGVKRYLKPPHNPNWLQIVHGLVAVAEGVVMVLSFGYIWPPWTDAVLTYKIKRTYNLHAPK